MRIAALLLGHIYFAMFNVAYSQPYPVFTEFSPPYQYPNKDNEIVGVATKRVEAIFERAGFTPRIRLYPWARSFHLVQNTPSAFIFSIARTQEREARFFWIAPVAKFKLALVSLNNGRLPQVTDWSQLSNYRFAVQRGDVGMTWLESKGLTEGNELVVCTDIACSWEYLDKGVVDFIIEDPELISATAEQTDLPSNRFTTNVVIPELEVVGYLAANRSTPPDVVARLQEAAAQLEQVDN